MASDAPPPRRTPYAGVFNARTLPIYAAFLFWGTGAGAQNLARPLFAYELTGDIFLVTLVLAFNAVARLFASPITGFMSDRWGRRPLLISGAGLRAISAMLEFFAGSYLVFFMLEFIGGIGIAMWNTSANILIADVTESHVRGRVVAVRGMSQRVGQVTGPLMGAVMVALFGLRSIFLFNGVTKLGTLVVAMYLIKESRDEPAPRPQGAAPEGQPAAPPRARFAGLRPFLTRSFILVILATFAVSMMGQGVFQGLLPLYAQELANLSAASIGTLMGIGGLVSVIVAFPNGMLSDSFGRKFSLVPGLALLGVSAGMLSVSTGYGGLLAMVLVYGLAWGMSQGTSQTYAMDLAPREGRGAFLGVWSLFQAAGGFVAPLAVGAMAQWWSFGGAYGVVAGWLGASALLIFLWAPETRPRPRPTA